MSTVTETGSLIPSLDASNLSYQVERVRMNYPNIDNTRNLLKRVREETAIPKNLSYVDDFYDSGTGTSGTAFQDTTTGEIIIAYTGTNPNGDGLRGKLEFGRDIYTDIADIGFGQGTHYSPAFTFYEQIAEKYGADKVSLTGHSLGGNIAQRVALRYNVQRTTVYNSAPLYIPVGAGLDNSPYTKANLLGIQSDLKAFTGQVTRITTEKDPLNRYADKVKGVYLGQEYILSASGGHGLDAIVNDANQVSQVSSLLKTASALQTVKASMADLSAKKSAFMADGSLSGREMIYLDSVQASIASAGISQVAEAALELVTAKEKESHEEAEQLYQELDDVPWYFILTPDEMRAAYAEAGVDYNSIVTAIDEHCSEKREKVSELATTFTTLQGQIERGIAAKVEQDAELAQLFGLS
ncbi:hypothetical protein AALH12_03105 [Streptococcus ferus]|uniref:hypothetical protein n=1 Tax=Streptococcus ferus TaxID=1345 RepID=UPI0035155773